MQINPIQVPRDFKAHEPSLPGQKRTPRPEDNKVVGNPDRVPVNKQAALIVQPVRSWLSQPPPEPKLPTKEQKEIDELRAQIKTERNVHARAKDEIGNLRIQLREAKAKIDRLTSDLLSLSRACQEKDDTIRQLEDIRL